MKAWPLTLLLLLLLPAGSTAVSAQPALNGKREIAGVEVFRDLTQPRQFYYLPGKLALAHEQSGRPKFQLVQLRYTGTALQGDQGDRGFFNLVQVGIERQPVTSAELTAIRNQLGPRANLDPLPVSSMEAFLLMPQAEDGGRYLRVGGTKGLSGQPKSGQKVWTETWFTARLGPREAELLWDGIEGGQLAFSIGYTVYASIVDDLAGEYRLAADSSARAELGELLEDFVAPDSVAAPHAVRAGSIPVELDAERWPDLSRRIDLNEGASPAWAFLEVRCYDFANALRPDLAMKTVEIEATGVTGDPVRLKPLRFLSSRPSVHTQEVRFPYAVDLTKPYRYRTVDYDVEGDRHAEEWTRAEKWAGLLDLTTPPEAIPYREHEIEVELDTAAFRQESVANVEVDLLYTRDGRPQREKMRWDLTKVSSATLQLRRFFADKESAVSYVLTVRSGSDAAGRSYPPRPVGSDQYLHLRPRPR